MKRQKMRLRQIASSIVVALLLVSMFGVMMVVAPPPSPMPTIPVESNVFVTNEAIDVTLDEPIEVEGTVGIDDSDPVDVEIANAEGLPLDVSGWLHTTIRGHQNLGIDLDPTEQTNIRLEEDTMGYRLLTLGFEHRGTTAADLDIEVIIVCYVDYVGFISDTFTIDASNQVDEYLKTYEIAGYAYGVHITNNHPTETLEADELVIQYFMTT
jgi:hypothetical protein